jgi:REP element-mobilizing transposase RayT
MGYPRKNLISLEDTPYYHCTARCVRRAWLCGVDEYAGKDHSHRKEWVTRRIGQLCSMFAIEVCAYAVMSNHYHLVLYVDAARARRWTQREVVGHWTRLFRAPHVVRQWLAGETAEEERLRAEEIIECWRRRLHEVSWFMRCLNEHLARLANAEDRCTGRFWEGRFKSHALLDESALLTAMAYVDLNPIRAGIARTPEGSAFTSIYDRIRRFNPRERAARSRIKLRPFRDEVEAPRSAVPYELSDYLSLVDWTGRSIRVGKPGFIKAELPPILRRLNIECESWQLLMNRRGTLFGRAMGHLDAVRIQAVTLGRSWVRGMRSAERAVPAS